MDSFILEDVNSLLKLKKGDSTRLDHIKELCETNGIISLSDRKYVERLSSQYLHKSDEAGQKKPDKPKFVPIKEEPILSKTEDHDKKLNDLTIQLKEADTPEIRSDKSILENFAFLSNKKIIYAIGAIVLAIILIAVVAVNYEGIQLISEESSGSNADPASPFAIESDKTSYKTSDIISISGNIDSPSDESVRVLIENEQGKLIWAETLDLKNNGEYSTLAIAGGNGWENAGKYNLIAEHEELTEKISFNFVP